MKATSILLSVVIVVLAACSSGRMGATSGGPSADSARPNETTASAVQVPPTPLEEVGFISEHYTLPRGYLDPEALPDSLALLPPPPADGTAAKAADQEAFKQAMQAPDKRWELAAVDAERMKRLFPIKAILEAGGNVSLGSDFPAAAYVADYKPLNAITQAVDAPDAG